MYITTRNYNISRSHNYNTITKTYKTNNFIKYTQNGTQLYNKIVYIEHCIIIHLRISPFYKHTNFSAPNAPSNWYNFALILLHFNGSYIGSTKIWNESIREEYNFISI